MKKLASLIAVVAVVISFNVFAGQSQFCNGFERGYATGYKQASGSAYEPYTPYCPYQPYKGYNDPESDYEHGYIIGYEKGLRAGRQ